MGAKTLSILMFLSTPGVISADGAQADKRLFETRYCSEPERYTDGRIKRDESVVRAFEKQYPLPANYNRDEWQIDHVIPLAQCGCDAVWNMQWLPKTIKTCADDDCKDRWERTGVYPKRCVQ